MEISDEQRYPQYYVIFNLQEGFRAYQTLKSIQESEKSEKPENLQELLLQIEKGKKSQRELLRQLETCKKTLKSIPIHLQDTAIKTCLKYQIREIPRILREYNLPA